MLKIVSNTSPLIFLAKLNTLSLLQNYAVFIPSVVQEELLKKESTERDRLLDFLSWKNVSIVSLREVKSFSHVLGKGELSVLQVALEKKIPYVLFDDRRARSLARILKLKPRGTLWILTQAFQEKRITKEQFRKFIFDLIVKGFRIDEELLIKILQKFTL